MQFVAATEGHDLYDVKTSCVGDMSFLTDEEIIDRYKKAQCGFRSFGVKDLSLLLPYKFIISLLGTCFFVLQYYIQHCTLTSVNEDGVYQWVSQPMHLPK